MKIGLRTPSIKKSFKARTTGKIRRRTASFINPLYGKKGIGLMRSPKKSIYNKIYRKTSFSVLNVIKKMFN